MPKQVAQIHWVLTGMLFGGAVVVAELGLAKGEWELDGCLIGVPVHPSTPSAEHLPENAVVSLESSFSTAEVTQ